MPTSNVQGPKTMLYDGENVLGVSGSPIVIDPAGVSVQPVAFVSPQHVIVDSGGGGGGGNAAASLTGTPVPTSADYLGYNASGNLIGVSSATPLPVTGNVSVSNLPATQPVSGSVSVSNFPGTQPVSGTVAVSALSGDVAVVNSATGGKTKLAVTADPVTFASPQHTIVDSGSLSVSNFPATQPVSGTVAVSGTVSTSSTQLPVALDGSGFLKVHEQGTASVSGTVTANIGSTNGLALDATLTGGTVKAIARGGAKGSTTVADITSTASGANHQPVDVAIYDASGNQITSFGGGTQYADGVTQATPTGTVALGKNGSNVLHAVSLDSSGNLNVNVAAGGASGGTSSTFGSTFPASGTAAGASDGTNMQPLLLESAANKNLRVGIFNGAVEVAVTGANALKVDGSAVIQPVSGTVTANVGSTNGLALDATLSASQGTVAAGTAATKSTLTGGVFNSVAPTLTTGQQASVQLDASGNLKIRPLTSSDQVTVANASIPVTQPTAANLNATVVGTGTFTVQAAQSGNWTSRTVGNGGATLDGTVVAGTAPTNGVATLGVFNTTLPTLTTGQSAAFQVDAKGQQLVDVNYWAGSPITAVPSTYGVAPTGNVPGVNASVTNLVTNNMTQVGGVAVAATAKATQGTNFVPVQDAKDTGRSTLTFFLDAAAGVAAEALVTMGITRGNTVVTPATSYTVTAGKTLRILSISATIVTSTTTALTTAAVRIRTAASAISVSSPIIANLRPVVGMPGTVVAGMGGYAFQAFPDGLEIAGGTQIAISQVVNSTASAVTITVVGYEY